MTDIARREPPDLPARMHPAHVHVPAPRDRPYDPLDMPSARTTVTRLWRRAPQAVAVFAIVFIPAAIGTYLATPLYRSTALVQVNPDPVQVMPYRDVADPTGTNVNAENYMGTQEQILKGPGLKTRVIRRLQTDLKNTPASSEAPVLGGRFAVKRIEKSELFELSYEGTSPRSAATIVNLFAEEYVRQNFELRQATRQKAEQDLKKELEALEEKLQLSEKELTVYAKAHDIVSLEQGQVDPLQERLTSLGQALVVSEGEVVAARSALNSIRTASVEQFPQRLMTVEIGQLQARLLQVDQEITTLRSTYGENWSAVRQRRGERALIVDQLRREMTTVLERYREQARLDLQTAEAKKSMSAQGLNEQKALVNKFHDASTQYNILKREVDTSRNLYDGLLQRLKQTGVLAGFQFGNIQIVEPGRANRVPSSPKVFWNLGLAALFGLALGVCFVILLEAWDDSIKTHEDAEQFASLPVLGGVPLVKAMAPSVSARALPAAIAAIVPLLRPAGTAGSNDPPSSDREPSETLHLTEAVRAICASILLSRSDERPRVVVITSAMHAEGKTTIAGYLGKAFADAGVRTLLVEADMRKPDLARSFAVGNEDGLSLYLAGQISSGPKIHKTDVPNLFITASGPPPPNPAALLHSERFGLFLQRATAEHQFVIIDAPPTLAAADARILSTNADGVVLVVRAGRTGRGLIRRAVAQLQGAGANIIGMVLNGCRPDQQEVSYYRYYREPA